MAIVNYGRKIEPVVGLSALAVNASGGVIMPTSVRHHRLKGKCVAVNYTGTGAQATTKITGAGNNAATVTLTIVNGQVTAAVIAAGGAGYAAGDQISPVDPTGQGAVLTVATINAGAILTLTVTNGGIASPIDPINFFASFLLKVKNAPFRSVSLDSMQRILNVRRIYPALGELVIEFTEYRRNMLAYNDSTSWDLTDGEKFEIQFKTLVTLVSPNFTLEYEYDLQQNIAPNAKGVATRFRNPVKYRETTINLNAGDNFFNRETLNTGGEPIFRMWFLGSTPGNITYMQVKSDSDIKLDGQVADLNEMYEKYEYSFGRGDFLNFNYAGSNLLKSQYNAPKYWDCGFIADVDGRLNEALVYNKLDVKLTSAIAQNGVRVLIESAPGDFI